MILPRLLLAQDSYLGVLRIEPEYATLTIVAMQDPNVSKGITVYSGTAEVKPFDRYTKLFTRDRREPTFQTTMRDLLFSAERHSRKRITTYLVWSHLGPRVLDDIKSDLNDVFLDRTFLIVDFQSDAERLELLTAGAGIAQDATVFNIRGDQTLTVSCSSEPDEKKISTDSQLHDVSNFCLRNSAFSVFTGPAPDRIALLLRPVGDMDPQTALTPTELRSLQLALQRKCDAPVDSLPTVDAQQLSERYCHDRSDASLFAFDQSTLSRTIDRILFIAQIKETSIITFVSETIYARINNSTC